jgi:hypothetical protein
MVSIIAVTEYNYYEAIHKKRILFLVLGEVRGNFDPEMHSAYK